MNEWAKVVVLGSEEQLQQADGALEAAGGYAKGFVYADEGGDGWAVYFVARPFLGRFSQIISGCGCSVGQRRHQAVGFGNKEAGEMGNNPTFGLWSRDDYPLPFRGARKGEASSPVEEEVMARVEERPEVERVRVKIRKLLAAGEELSWAKVIDIIARDNYLASRVTTKTVRQVLREFLCLLAIYYGQANVR